MKRGGGGHNKSHGIQDSPIVDCKCLWGGGHNKFNGIRDSPIIDYK